MKINQLRLKEFKRFDDLTIDLGNVSKKIVALVGPNGCGKSSVFDAFEQKHKDFRNPGNEDNSFYSKAAFYKDATLRHDGFDRNSAITIDSASPFTRKSFYIRTAYRVSPKFSIKEIGVMPGILEANDEPMSSIAIDKRLESNYKRLLGSAFTEFFDGAKTGDKVREELIGKINGILRSVLDVEISNFGNVFENKGQLYFKKGNVRDFPYTNLSSGEKEVIDIVLDLIVKTREYDDTVFCIDEPELHLNTAIQRKLLIELEKLVPDNCQLWVATHSIGFLRALQEELKDQCQILDFSEKNYFEGKQTIRPMRPTRANWTRIFSTALEDLTGLIAPKRLVYCEGRDAPGVNGRERGFDAKVYNAVFSEKHNDTQFISSGGNTELDHRSEIAIAILTKVFSDMEIWVLKDRDMASGKIVDEAARRNYLTNNLQSHRVLYRYEIENYLFDREILKKYCKKHSLIFKEADYDVFVTDIVNQDLKDNVNHFRNFCSIVAPVNAEQFKLNLAESLTPETTTYDELHACVFDRG